MKFAVLGSSSAIEQLKNIPGFIYGSSSVEPIDYTQLKALLPKINLILVELNDTFLEFCYNYNLIKIPINIAYFENNNEQVTLNSNISRTFKDIMQVYHNVQSQTQGQIGYLDIAAIILKSLQHLQNLSHKKITALEIGSWTGCSSFFLTKVINSNDYTGTLYCCDTWRGSKYWNYEIANFIDMFAVFRGNMTYFKAYDKTIPILGDSTISLNILKDNSFDLIFIDGDHRYDIFSQDLNLALQKLKPGGLLIGHDCNGYAENLPKDFLLENLDKDCAFYEGKQYSCGVLKALQEKFDKSYNVFRGSLIWYTYI